MLTDKQKNSRMINMTHWEVPLYSKSRVSKAGNRVAKHIQEIGSSSHSKIQEIMADDIDVINNYRASHAFPLNTFQIALRKCARDVDPDAIVAQRLKRMPTIINKLSIFTEMNLARMQDIGGCRAVSSSLNETYEISEKFKSRRAKHELLNIKDYIQEPKFSGYRGIHLIYKYYSDRKNTYNGLRIEVQLRTRLQHAWATAVETAGMLLKQQLKSSQGEEDWLEFFRYASSAISILEGTPPLHCDKTEEEIKHHLKHLEEKLHASELLTAVSNAMQRRDEAPNLKNAFHYIMKVDIETKDLDIIGFPKKETLTANKKYALMEEEYRDNDNIDIVLVSVESFISLKSAYPNYYGDASMFINTIQEIIDKK